MKRTKSKPTRRDDRNQLYNKPVPPERLTFIAHIQELRRRLFYVGISVLAFGGLAATVQSRISDILLNPAGDQQFIYTTPGGGFDYTFKICLYSGIAASIPVIVYQIIRYAQPLVSERNRRFIRRSGLWSAVLAVVGILFGYFIGLPASMHFLLQGFSSNQIQALISIQSYINFVLIYLLGAAFLFQLPLILLVINKIKPLQPKKLLKYQRWVILGSFIVGAIISPTPDVRNQAMMSGPVILMYELSILLIWLINRRHKRPKKIVRLLDQDIQAQTERIAKFREAQGTWQKLISQSQSAPATKQPIGASPVASTVASRPQGYTQPLARRRYVSVSEQPSQTE